jgi:plasmid replication initiation protein
MASELVIKTNRLNMAIHNLSLAEVRIIQLAIVDARETGKGLSADTPLRIQASRYAEVFGTTRQTAHEVILAAEKSLFERRFTFIDEKDNRPVKSGWVQRVKYFTDESAIEIIFTQDVVEEIKRINGTETPFTEYLLSQISDLSSVYATRLYELLIQWKSVCKTPIFELNQFREQLGVCVNEYQRMHHFKSRVLDLAITQINEHTDITASYEQVKKGRVITGFSFKFKQKAKPIEQAPAATPKNTPENTPVKPLNSRIAAFAGFELLILNQLKKTYPDLTERNIHEMARKESVSSLAILERMKNEIGKVSDYALEKSN